MTTGHPQDPILSPSVRALGFAGLAPQAAAVIMQIWSRVSQHSDIPVAANASIAALVYGAVILSFLGGIWWGVAIRRSTGQGSLALLAVIPSLAAAGLIGFAAITGIRWALVAMGSAIMFTLLVDRRLARSGEMPAGWMGHLIDTLLAVLAGKALGQTRRRRIVKLVEGDIDRARAHSRPP